MAYNIGSDQLGQFGSGFSDEEVEVVAPAGKVIIAIQFLEATVLSTLVAATDNPEAAYFSHTTAVQAVHGSGSDETDSGTTFPKGLTIYGRWTSVELTGASAAGGIICYLGH